MYDENGELVSRHNDDNNETSGANNDQIETNNDSLLFEFSPIKDNSQPAFSSTPTPNCPTTSTPVKENEPSFRRQLSYNDIETNEINCVITPAYVLNTIVNMLHYYQIYLLIP